MLAVGVKKGGGIIGGGGKTFVRNIPVICMVTFSANKYKNLFRELNLPV